MKPQVDVVFVIPGNLKEVYQVFAAEHAIEPPIFALWMASYLMHKGISVAIVDAVAMDLGPEEVAREVSDINPRLVVTAVYGFQPSASSQNMPAARFVCQAIKNLRPDLKILITGTHSAALPERTLREEAVDFVCDGEGPVTIYETLQALKAGGDFKNVSGVLYWGDSEKKTIIHNPSSPLISNLDVETPDIPWHLIPMARYRAHDWHTNYYDVETRSPYGSILTTLGCPYHCTFCCIQSPFRAGQKLEGKREEYNSYRYWSPQSVVKIIEPLVRDYGVKHIKIHDEMFVLNGKHVLGVAELIKERFGDSLNIWAYARVDTTKPQFLDALRAAGFRWLGIGIESGSKHVRDGVDKSFKDETIPEVVRRVDAAGIQVGANYIFGLPDDTYESMQDTLSLAIELNTPYANLYCAMAYPGSKLYTMAKEKGWPLPDDPGGPGWIGYSQHAYETMPLPTEKLSAAEVLRFRDKAWFTYNTRPEYLDLIRSKFGETAVKNIQRTTSLPPLPRMLLEQAGKMTTV